MYLRFTRARAGIACLTLILGLTSSWVAGLISVIETALVDRLISTPTVAADSSAASLVDSTKDVNDIYRVLIHQLFVMDQTKLVVIEARTTGCPMYESEEHRREFSMPDSFDSIVHKRLNTVEQETLADYLGKNKESHILTGISDLGIAYVLVTDDDLKEAFSEHGIDRGWTRFYKKYPGSSGIVFFSTVGFNRDNTQAFVYAGKQCGGLCGAGDYVLLKKENGIWAIQQRMALWVS